MSSVLSEEGAAGPVLRNEHLEFEAHLNQGTFDLRPAQRGPPGISGAATSLTLIGGHAFTSRGSGYLFDNTILLDNGLGRGLALVLRREAEEHEPELLLTAALYETQPFLVVHSEVANKGPAPIPVASFQVMHGGRLDLGSAVERWHFYKHGWQSWSPALVLPCSGEDSPLAPPVLAPATQAAPARGRFVSEMITAILDPATNVALVAGFVSAADQFSQLWLDRGDTALTATSYADGIRVRPGGRLRSERLYIEPARRPPEAMARYGDCLGLEMAALPRRHAIAGWCSWYYYWQGVSEEHILANLDYLAAHRRELPLEVIQIDDGYQTGIGDWLTSNEKFPHGMQWLAERIHAKGFKAGLWLAPFLIGAKSRLWQSHPEWAVHHGEGRPYVAMLNWEQECYALDLTRPDVIAWLEHLFRTVCEEWGFDYVKIDFSYAGAVDGLRYDPEVTRAQAYRRGLGAIRSAVGERFLLACGNPMGPSVGLVDGARVGPDVAPFWRPLASGHDPDRSGLSRPSALNSSRNSINRLWMHGRLWLNDPDCLLARDSETALSADEVYTLATVSAMSGGPLLDSDDLMRLSEERRELISMLLPVYGKAAVPLDLFQSEMPRLLELDCGRHSMLAVFNWDEEAAEMRAPLPAEDTHVFDVWAREYLGLWREAIIIQVAAHGCRLLALRPATGRPQAVGSSFHLLQGAVELESEDWDGEVLRLSLRPVAKRTGEIFVHAPYGWAPPAVIGPESAEVSPVASGLSSLTLSIDREMDIALKFVKE